MATGIPDLGYALAFTGHRPSKLGGYGPSVVQRRVREAIRSYLEKWRPDHAISGMALGVDQWAAEIALELEIPLIAAIPFVGQESAWPSRASRAQYRSLVARAKRVVIVSKGGYSPAKMQRRNEWMVDNCTELFAVWDGSSGGTANCVAYAKRCDVPIIRCDPFAA